MDIAQKFGIRDVPLFRDRTDNSTAIVHKQY